jgi:hypothetical protein
LTASSKAGHGFEITFVALTFHREKYILNPDAAMQRQCVTPIDLVSVLNDAPAGEWLALSFKRDRIVAHAPRLIDAQKAAIEAGEAMPIMMKLPPPYTQIL